MLFLSKTSVILEWFWSSS